MVQSCLKLADHRIKEYVVSLKIPVHTNAYLSQQSYCLKLYYVNTY